MTTTNEAAIPLKKTSQTSYFQLFVASVFLGPPLVMAWLWLARRILEPQDVETFKVALMSLWALITSGSGGTSLAGGYVRTLFKIDREKTGVANVGADVAGADDNEGFGLQDDEDDA